MSSKFLDKTGLNTLWAKIKSTFQTLGNLVTAWGSTPSDTKYPSEKLVKTALDGKAASSHTHTLLSAEPLANAQLPNNSEYEHFKRFYGYVPSYLAAVKLYDVTEFYDGTIVNNSNEKSTFVGDVSFIRTGGIQLVSKSKVCMTQGYNSSGVILYGDSTRCHPIVLKDSRNVLSSWISGSYIPTGDIGSTVNMTPTTNSNLAHCVIDCASYSTLYVNLSSVTGAPAWTFIDSTNKVIAKASSIDANTTLDVPQGAAKIICAITNTSDIKKYSYVAAESATPRYYLALQTKITMSCYMVCEGRYLTRTTATSTISARPLITEDFSISNTGAKSTALPAGYSVHVDTSYTDVAGTLGTARKLAVSLSNTSTDTTFNGSADVTNIKTTGTLGIANGGTGATTAKTAANNLLSGLPDWTANPTDEVKLIRRDTGGSASFGQVTFLTVWNYIVGKISSVLGLTATNYGGTADTATNVSGTQVGQDSNARHLWFSTTIESKRGYIDSLTYRSDTNTISANISGNAATATKATSDADGNNIKSNYMKATSGTKALAFGSSTQIGTVGGSAVNVSLPSLPPIPNRLEIFTGIRVSKPLSQNWYDGYGASLLTFYGGSGHIYHIGFRLIGGSSATSSNPFLPGTRIYITVEGDASEFVQNLEVYWKVVDDNVEVMVLTPLASSSGTLRINLKGVLTRDYGLTTSNSTIISTLTPNTNGWTRKTEDIVFNRMQTLLPNNGGSGVNLKYGINISGTADNALAADAAGVAGKLDASGGSSIQPVYFPSSGNNAGKPVPIPFDSTLTSYLTMQVTNSNYANSAGTANKWTSPRTITIMDDSLTNAGTTTTGVDGSGNVVLRLPTTIIANLGGTSEQANKDSNGNWIHLTYATKTEVTTNHYTKGQSDSIFAAASEGALGFSSPGNPQNYATGTSSSLSGDYIVQFSKGTTYANSINVLPTFAEGTAGYRVNVPLYKDTTERDPSATIVPNSTTVGYGTLLNYAYQRRSGKIGTLVGAVCFRPVVYKYVYGSIQQDTLLTDSEDWYLMSKSGTKVKGSVKPSDYSTLSIKLPTGINSAIGVGIVNVIENSSVTARVWCRIENGLLTFITDASNFGVFTRGKFYGFNVILNF